MRAAIQIEDRIDLKIVGDGADHAAAEEARKQLQDGLSLLRFALAGKGGGALLTTLRWPR